MQPTGINFHLSKNVLKMEIQDIVYTRDIDNNAYFFLSWMICDFIDVIYNIVIYYLDLLVIKMATICFFYAHNFEFFTPSSLLSVAIM